MVVPSWFFKVCRCVMATTHHSIITTCGGKTTLAFRRIVLKKAEPVSPSTAKPRMTAYKLEPPSLPALRPRSESSVPWYTLRFDALQALNWSCQIDTDGPRAAMHRADLGGIAYHMQEVEEGGHVVTTAMVVPQVQAPPFLVRTDIDGGVTTPVLLLPPQHREVS